MRGRRVPTGRVPTDGGSQPTGGSRTPAGSHRAGSSPVGSGRGQAKQAAAGNHASAAPCITRPDYGGLGAAVDLFAANNNGSTGPAEPTPGAAWYQVIGTARGCVTAYSVQDSARPPLGTHDMLDLVSPYLPRDARQIVARPSCAVWESVSLRRATGLPYAEASAIAQIGGLRPGNAQMRITAASPLLAAAGRRAAGRQERGSRDRK